MGYSWDTNLGWLRLSTPQYVVKEQGRLIDLFFGEVTIKLVGSSRIVYIETRDGSKISSAWFGFSESSPQKIVFFFQFRTCFCVFKTFFGVWFFYTSEDGG
jgi:hypothetical protein